MAKIKVSEASGRMLNWLVGVANNIPNLHLVAKPGKLCVYGALPMPSGELLDWPFQPSTDWAQGGPIIDLEKISCHPTYTSGATESGAEVAVSNGWVCFQTPRLSWQKVRFRQAGATLLIAAMRCYVVSKLGEEVEVPEELLEK